MGRDADQAHVFGDGHGAVKRGDLVGRDDERTPTAIEVLRIHDVRFHLALDRFLREEEVDLGLVHLLHGGRAVVHLEQQMASRLSHVADGGRKFERRRARHPSAKQELLHIYTVIPEALVAWIGVGGVHGLGLGNH